MPKIPLTGWLLAGGALAMIAAGIFMIIIASKKQAGLGVRRPITRSTLLNGVALLLVGCASLLSLYVLTAHPASDVATMALGIAVGLFVVIVVILVVSLFLAVNVAFSQRQGGQGEE